MHYEFYIDVYIAVNFFFDYLALFLLREIRRKTVKVRRMAAAALLSVLCSTACMLLWKGAWYYKAAVHFVINPLMFYGCFRQKSIREFFIDYISGYFSMMLLGGAVEWLCHLTGQTHLFGWVMAVTAGLMTLFLLLYQNGKEEENIYDIRICHGGHEVSAKGFFDTGNLLTDPYVNLPVSLIAKETLADILQAEELRCRYIPFVSLGAKNGLVQAVTLDSLEVRKKKKELIIQPAVFAVVEEEFLKNSEYRVILNGRLW